MLRPPTISRPIFISMRVDQVSKKAKIPVKRTGEHSREIRKVGFENRKLWFIEIPYKILNPLYQTLQVLGNTCAGT